MTRHDARKTALQMIYQRDIGHNSEDMVLHTLKDADLSKKDEKFALQLASGVFAAQEAIDDKIKEAAKEWTVERLFSVDRNILRLAIFETFYEPRTPAKIAINEAVELAKVFSTEESGSFINAFLDKLIKEYQAQLDEKGEE